MAAPLTFGDLLRRYRRAAGLSQEALAEQAGVSWRTISDLERGINRKPQQETRRLLVEALALSPEERARIDAALRTVGEETPSPASLPPVPPSSAPPPPVPTTVARGDAMPRAIPAPIPMTPLIGREDETAALCALIRRDDARLVTITGPGGVGKSRLALATLAALAPDYPDGAWFVPLAAVRDPALTLSTVLHALGIEEQAGQAPEAALIDALREATALLVLDNFEQLLPVAATIAAVTAACPYLRLIVTSRAALRVYGEQEYPLAPLAVPDARAGAAVVAQSAAVELFRQRASAVQPGFAISALNAASVAGICAALDGLPLALELAAARTKLFSPAVLLARLTEAHSDARLRLLTGGARDVPERQRTMRDAIAWSYDLLAPEDQTLFRRLSVFVGGWTLDAAEAVCGGAGAPDIYDGITTLIDNSMIRTEDRGTGEVRFRMLETMREFGWQQAAARGEAAAIRARHRDYCVAFAETARAELDGPEQVRQVIRLLEEYGNLRAALAAAQEAGASVIGLRLAVALAPFWQRYGYYAEGQAWLEHFLGDVAEDAAAPTLLRARALNAAGTLAAEQGDTGRALALHTQAYDRAVVLEDAAEQAAALANLGHTEEIRGNFARAGAYLADALTYYRMMGDEPGIAAALVQLGLTQRRLGTYPAARASFEESLTLHRALNNPQGVARSLFNLGTVAYNFNELDRATALLSQSMAMYQEMEEKPGIAGCVQNLGLVAWKQHDYPRALALQEQGLAIHREFGDKRAAANALNNIGIILERTGELARAEAVHTESLALRRQMNDMWGITMSLNNLGTVAEARGDRVQAIAFCEEGLALRRAHGHRQGIAESAYHLAIIVQRDGDNARAEALQREALSIYREIEARTHIAACLIALGDLAAERGEDPRAVRLCAAGTAFYAAIGTQLRPEAQAAAERIRTVVQDRLGAAPFAAAWDAGTALPPAHALDEALVTRS